jgi:hypothetical protein
MGTKIKIAKNVKVTNGLERRNPSKPAMLYLLELRSRVASAGIPRPKQKLVITIDSRGGGDHLPQPIKISQR